MDITLSKDFFKTISTEHPPSFLNIKCYHQVRRKLKQNDDRQLWTVLKCECHQF